MLKQLNINLLLLAVLGNFTFLSTAKAGFNGNITLEINGLKNKQGQLCASIFANHQGFPNQPQRVIQKQCSKITDTPVNITFENLKAGSYAIAVMHDQNQDFILNRNSFGMPIEGFGFSKNPEITTKAPKFEEAAILVAGPNTKVVINLKYF